MPDRSIFTSADPDWDEVRRAWNLAVDQHPAAVAVPRTAQDVVDAVGFARQRGLRVIAQGTGHGAAAAGSLAGTVLVNMRAMRRLTVDPAARTARVEAGVIWQEVADAAAKHGLAGLAGSSPDVGVVGYTLGGGMSWLGRCYGLSANNVEAFELVTADGRLVRANWQDEPDLFWALRGGGGSFGVVTAIDLRLFAVTEAYAGLLWWPAEAGAQVLHEWRKLTQGRVPEEFSTSARYLNFPSAPGVPDHLRGRSFAVICVVHLGAPAQADDLLAPLRALHPVTDTVQPVPAQDLGHVHMDPEQPVPAVGDGFLLQSLPAEAVDELVRVAGPRAASPLLTVTLRHVGGEMSRARPHHGALAAVPAPYTAYAAGLAASAGASSAVSGYLETVRSALSPWTAPRAYLNLAETGGDPSRFWSPEAYERLRRIKAAVDPQDMIRANHSIPPAARHPVGALLRSRRAGA
jgi:FAD/FMN-containing dehydrogenase